VLPVIQVWNRVQTFFINIVMARLESG